MFLLDRERSERVFSYHPLGGHTKPSGADMLSIPESRKTEIKRDAAVVAQSPLVRHSPGRGRMDYGSQFNLGEVNAGISLWAPGHAVFRLCGLWAIQETDLTENGLSVTTVVAFSDSRGISRVG